MLIYQKGVLRLLNSRAIVVILVCSGASEFDVACLVFAVVFVRMFVRKTVINSQVCCCLWFIECPAHCSLIVRALFLPECQNMPYGSALKYSTKNDTSIILPFLFEGSLKNVLIERIWCLFIIWFESM